MKKKTCSYILVILAVGSCLVILSSLNAANRTSYEPSWESLDRRPTPKWFSQAKFGIFIHWGVYSVPAWCPKGQFAELYVGQDGISRMRKEGSPTWKFHRRVYGKDFEYKDFAQRFQAELFDPDQWADLFERAGARYVVLTSRHNTEAFCLWPAPDSKDWNSVDVGPKRDLCGDLAQAVRARGLMMGLYYGFIEWYNPYSNLYRQDLNKYITQRVMPQLKDLVLRYKPSLLFMDGDWAHPAEVFRSQEFLAWLFNEGPNPDEVVINDRWGQGCRHKHGGYYTTEFGAGLKDSDHPWEECRGMGMSFGYNRNESLDDYKTARELILILVDVVSRGGNLLLDVGPTADGRIPVIMQQRLVQIGQWLKVNGEAIYATKPWRNNCQWTSGEVPKVEYGKEYMAKYDINELTGKPTGTKAVIEAFFTCKDNTLYAITPRWPGRQFKLNNLNPARDTIVTMLGWQEQLRWKAVDGDIIIQVPQLSVDEVPCEYAYVLKLTGIGQSKALQKNNVN